jgi:hypothetical protein
MFLLPSRRITGPFRRIPEIFILKTYTILRCVAGLDEPPKIPNASDAGRSSLFVMATQSRGSTAPERRRRSLQIFYRPLTPERLRVWRQISLRSIRLALSLTANTYVLRAHLLAVCDLWSGRPRPSRRRRCPYSLKRLSMRREFSVQHRTGKSSGPQIFELLRFERSPGMVRHGQVTLRERKPQWRWGGPSDQSRRRRRRRATSRTPC